MANLDNRNQQTLTYGAMVKQLTELIKGSILAETGLSTLVGNLDTGLFLNVFRNSVGRDSAERILFYGNIKTPDSALVKSYALDLIEYRGDSGVIAKVAQLINEGVAIAPWWSGKIDEYYLRQFDIPTKHPNIANAMNSRFELHTPYPQFSNHDGSAPSGVTVPQPGKILVQDVSTAFIKHDNHSSLYRVHLDSPYFMPVSLVTSLAEHRMAAEARGYDSSTEFSIMYPVDQAETGAMHPKAGLVSITSKNKYVSSAQNPPVGFVSNILGVITDPGYMPLAQALEKYGAARGISATITTQGLQFFQNGEPISYDNACLELSDEASEQKKKSIGQETSKVRDTFAPVKIKKGGIIVTSREDIFQALAAISGFDPVSETSTPEPAPDAVNATSLAEASLLRFGQSLTPKATHESINKVIEELIQNPGNRIDIPFDCSGHISDGTSSTLTFQGNKGEFPAYLSFAGGGYGEHHLSRASEGAKLARVISSIEFELPVESHSSDSHIFVVNFEALKQNGFIFKNEYSQLTGNGTLDLEKDGISATVEIQPQYYEYGMGVTNSGAVVYRGRQDNPDYNFRLGVKMTITDYPKDISDEEIQDRVGKLRAKLVEILNLPAA